METLFKKHRVLVSQVNMKIVRQLMDSNNKSVTKMQKPDKIYLHNPNMHYALSPEQFLFTPCI